MTNGPSLVALLSFASIYVDQGKGKALWMAIAQAKGKGKGLAKGKHARKESEAPSDTPMPDQKLTATIAKRATAEASKMNDSHQTKEEQKFKRLRRVKTKDIPSEMPLALESEPHAGDKNQEKSRPKAGKKPERKSTTEMDDNKDDKSGKTTEEGESRKKNGKSRNKDGKIAKKKTDGKSLKKLKRLKRAGKMKSASAETLAYENPEEKDDKDGNGGAPAVKKVACHLFQGTCLEHLAAFSRECA